MDLLMRPNAGERKVKPTTPAPLAFVPFNKTLLQFSRVAPGRAESPLPVPRPVAPALWDLGAHQASKDLRRKQPSPPGMGEGLHRVGP